MNKIKRSALSTLVLAFLCTTTAIAQDKTVDKGSYYNKNKINVLSGGNNYGNDKGINLSTIHGINLSDKFAAGLGIGVTGGNKYPSTLVPVFVNGLLSVTDNRKLYLSGDLGYSFGTEKDFREGLLGELSIGWKFKIGKFAIAPEVGYRYDGFKTPIYEAIMTEENYIIRKTNSYHSYHLNSLSAGISLFF